MTTRRIALLFGGLIVSLALVGLQAAGPTRSVRAASTTVVINEIFNSNTGSPPASNEYVELYNISNAPIDLTNYFLYNRTGRDSLAGIPNPIIQPGQFLAIGATQLPGGNIGGGNIVSGVDIGLANDADYVGLAVANPTDTAIDAINWGNVNPNWFGYNLFAGEFITTGQPSSFPPDSDTLNRFPDGRDTNSGSDLAFLSSSPGAASCDDPFEPDNTIATAQSFSTASGVQLHRLCPSGDQDWYGIAMSTAVQYTISVTPTGSSLVATVRLYDANSVLVATGIPSSPNGRGSTIYSYQPSTTGTYYAQVTGTNGGSGAEWLYNIGLATVTVGQTPTPGSPTPVSGCADAYEPDNTLQQARQILLNTEQTHIICPVGDRDWVIAEVGPGKVYHWFTKDLAGPLDTIMSLYDANGNVLQSNDDYPGRGLGSQIDYSFNSVQNVYIQVRDKTLSGGNGFSYNLDFTVDPGPLSPTATISPTITPTAMPTVPGCLDAYEDDGAAANAKLILINDVPQHRSFCPAGDADWVRFFAGKGKAYTLRTLNPNGGAPAPGVDPYLYLFDSDGRTVIDENDDGGDGVNTRIDFFPQRDDYYYIQVKNKGDIGGPNQQYDLQITVLPGAPGLPPTLTPTPLIAPIITTSPAVQPTEPPKPTEPPPVPGQVTDTPVPAPTQSTLVAVPDLTGLTPDQAQAKLGALGLKAQITGEEANDTIPAGAIVRQDPPAGTSVAPGVAINLVVSSGPGQPAPPTEEATATPEPVIGLPGTGGEGRPDLISLPVTVYVDLNRNGRYDAGEGVRGLDLIFRTADGTTEVTASTNRTGGSQVLLLRGVAQRLFIPYLGSIFDVTPSKSGVQLGFPAPHLPVRIP